MCLAKFECPKINMKILMSGFHELRYLDLFNQTAKIFFKAPVEQRQNPDGEMITAHWGITWNEDYIYATHNRVVHHEERPKISQEIITFGRNGMVLKTLPIAHNLFTRGHQIQYYQGYLYITDTGSNCIQRVNCDTLRSQGMIPNAEKFGEDLDHINSLFIDSGKLYIGCLEGTVYVYDIETLGLIRELTFPKEVHNVFILEDQILTNHSNHGEIVNSSEDCFLKVGVYNRGIVITDEHILVGQSTRLIRERREGDSEGYINIFNRTTKEKIGRIVLPTIGQVLEIRCLDQKDYAHNGIVFCK